MTELSATYSHSSLPFRSCPKTFDYLSPPTVLIPVSTSKSPKLFTNGKRRNKFRRNSADPERDYQFSQGKAEISKDIGISNRPSTSFLSVLCPLLKLFSVSVSSSHSLVFAYKLVGISLKFPSRSITIMFKF